MNDASADARPVTVLAVDDQPVFLRALRRLLAATAPFRQVGEAGSGAEALELAGRLHPDLVLLDVQMPDMNGIETARRLSAAGEAPVIVLMSAEDIPPAAVEEPAVTSTIGKCELSSARLRELWATIRG